MKLSYWLRMALVISIILIVMQNIQSKLLAEAGLPRVLSPKWQEVLSCGIPGFNQQKSTPIAADPVDYSRRALFRRLILLGTNIDIDHTKSILGAEIAGLRVAINSPRPVVVRSLPKKKQNFISAFVFADKPTIGIYHTHTSESFIPYSGESHRRGGNIGDIVLVGEVAEKRFATHGIKTVHSKAIHDYPSFMKAYSVSEETAVQMLKKYPSLQALFDIHRDAEKKEKITVIIDGQSMAKILLVVAQGQTDLPQPHWKENHAFAKEIDAKLQEKYPGLSRGIQIVDWRYNQHLHPRALLVEVGSQESTLEEATRSIEVFADVVTEIIAEGSR